jgi:hypothetical protein
MDGIFIGGPAEKAGGSLHLKYIGCVKIPVKRASNFALDFIPSTDHANVRAGKV